MRHRLVKTVTALVVLVTMVVVPSLAADSQPSIRVTVVPPAGPGGEELHPIAGTVEHAPTGAVVVIWARSVENLYWVQPRGNFYRTQIGPEGLFSTVTHPGLEYSVAVTRSTFTSPMIRNSLPAVGGDVLALVTVPGK